MKLADYLKAHGISRRVFAVSIGVTQPALSRYVRSEQIPARWVMARIVTETGGDVTPNDFYGVSPAAAEQAAAAS